eukprot:COSAG06_NODE_3841_length_4845_cov_99.594817_3_plen_158_part_00
MDEGSLDGSIVIDGDDGDDDDDDEAEEISIDAGSDGNDDISIDAGSGDDISIDAGSGDDISIDAGSGDDISIDGNGDESLEFAEDDDDDMQVAEERVDGRVSSGGVFSLLLADGGPASAAGSGQWALLCRVASDLSVRRRRDATKPAHLFGAKKRAY